MHILSTLQNSPAEWEKRKLINSDSTGAYLRTKYVTPVTSSSEVTCVFEMARKGCKQTKYVLENTYESVK